VGFDLLNYRWVFSARRLLQSAVASGTSNPQLGGPVIRTFKLPLPGVPHIWNDASEPQQRKVELWAKNFREFCRKWRLPRHFCVLLHAVNLRHGTDGFTSPPKEGVLRIFSPEKSDGFGRVWTREQSYTLCWINWAIWTPHCQGIFSSVSLFVQTRFLSQSKQYLLEKERRKEKEERVFLWSLESNLRHITRSE